MRSGISNDEYLAKSVDVFCLILKTKNTFPIKGETIQQITGIDKRIVAEMLREFEKRGFPICSGTNGYKYARTRIEFLRHLVKERQRARSILYKVSKASKARIEEPTLFNQEAA